MAEYMKGPGYEYEDPYSDRVIQSERRQINFDERERRHLEDYSSWYNREYGNPRHDNEHQEC